MGFLHFGGPVDYNQDQDQGVLFICFNDCLVGMIHRVEIYLIRLLLIALKLLHLSHFQEVEAISSIFIVWKFSFSVVSDQAINYKFYSVVTIRCQKMTPLCFFFLTGEMPVFELWYLHFSPLPPNLSVSFTLYIFLGICV